MRSNRRWNGLAAALAVVALSACAEGDPFDPAATHDRPQLAVVPGPAAFDFEGFASGEILVDVQQGSVNLKSQGLLPVAILGEPDFDPVADVNLSTVTLGDGPDEDTPLARKRHGTYMAAGGDVNSDGLRDLVLHFSTPSLVTNGDLTSASTELVLRGATKNGVAFAGSDTIRVVP